MKKLIQHFISAVALLHCLSTFSYAQTPQGVVPVIYIITNDGLYGEPIGGLCFNVNLSNPVGSTTYVDVAVLPSSTSTLGAGADFTYTPTTIAFPPNFSGNESVCININDDALAEPIETINLKLTNPTNNAILGDSLISFTIYDNDSVSNLNPCSDLFISEYIHSLAPAAKAIEIYNPTGLVVDLSEYSIQIYYDGSPVSGTIITPTGFLNYADKYIIAETSSDAAVTALADTLSQVLNYSGDDAVVLYHNNTIIDIIGTIGQDPGLYWPAGSSQTASATLVRKQNILDGETDWNVSSGQWNVFPQGTFTDLNAHTINGCGFIVPPTVTMVTSDATFDESIGGLGISAGIFNPSSTTATTVNVIVGSSSTASNGSDFTYNPTSITFPAGFSGNMSIGISINDDAIAEADELLYITLTNPTNNAVLLDSVWILTIEDNDGIGVGEKTTNDDLNIYPNPATGQLLITAPFTIESYCISDVAGRKCLAENNVQANKKQISIDELSYGIYSLMIIGNDKTIVRKFVKQ